MKKCNFILSPIGGFNCQVCGFHSDDQNLDRECTPIEKSSSPKKDKKCGGCGSAHVPSDEERERMKKKIDKHFEQLGKKRNSCQIIKLPLTALF